MEARCTKILEDAKLKELESVVAAWLTIVERNDAIQLESDVEGDNGDNDEENDDQMFEDDEQNGIQDDTEADENDEDNPDYSSEGWETEGDDRPEEALRGP